MESTTQSKLISHILGLTVLMVAIIFAVAIKEKDLEEPVGANLEATYHVLLTIEALRQNPIHDHWLLPTVTLGQERDAFIPWGATVPTKSGDYIYTSFTPPGFLLPYVVFEVFDLQPTVRNLARLNMTIGAIVGISLYLLIIRLLSYSGFPTHVVILAGLAGASIAFFSREALLSTGVIYWPHALYQLIFIISLHLYLNYKRKAPSRMLLLCLFLGAWTEWTGYVFNLGMALVMWYHHNRQFAIKVIMVTVAVGITTILHYGFGIGFYELLRSWYERFLSRYGHDRFSEVFPSLFSGYGLSYGLFLVTVLAVLIRLAYSPDTNLTRQSAVISTTLLISTLPLIENLIVLQHATQFSFSRMKFMFPAAMLISIGLVDRKLWFRLLVITLTILSCFQGYELYRIDRDAYSSWAVYHRSNVELVERLKQQVDLRCATIASNTLVRGYDNLLFGRSIYEYQAPDQVFLLNEKRRGCVSVFLEGKMVLVDLNHYTKVTVTYPDGHEFVLVNPSS